MPIIDKKDDQVGSEGKGTPAEEGKVCLRKNLILDTKE